MLKIIEKNFLEDDFIIKPFASNINIHDNIYFKKNDVYYFGNYQKNKINQIRKKINSNKKRIIKAIEKGTYFIIHGNSIELFNNSFKSENINLFNAYEEKKVKKRKKVKFVNDLNFGINSLNFRYKNLICFK